MVIAWGCSLRSARLFQLSLRDAVRSDPHAVRGRCGAMSVMNVGFVAIDGESNWMEAVMSVRVYLMLAIAFFFLPA